MAPCYTDYFWYRATGESYTAGYYRLAGWDPVATLDWSNSGHSQPGPIMRMHDRGSDDVILCDYLRFIEQTASYPQYAHELDPTEGFYDNYRENNLGYADGHAEMHRHRHGMVKGQPLNPPEPDWGGESIKMNFSGLAEYIIY